MSEGEIEVNPGEEFPDLEELRKDERLYFKCESCNWEGKSGNRLHMLGMCPRCQAKTLKIIGVITYLD